MEYDTGLVTQLLLWYCFTNTVLFMKMLFIDLVLVEIFQRYGCVPFGLWLKELKCIWKLKKKTLSWAHQNFMVIFFKKKFIKFLLLKEVPGGTMSIKCKADSEGIVLRASVVKWMQLVFEAIDNIPKHLHSLEWDFEYQHCQKNGDRDSKMSIDPCSDYSTNNSLSVLGIKMYNKFIKRLMLTKLVSSATISSAIKILQTFGKSS